MTRDLRLYISDRLDSIAKIEHGLFKNRVFTY